MGRQVTIDLATGAGSSAEFLMGKVLVESTAIHFVGDTFVLPDPVELPLFNGKAVHPDMAPSPDGPEPVWAYKFTFTSGITGRSWSEIRGVPDGTTNINYRLLPKFQGGPNPPELAPSVEYLVAEALASDPTITAAAETAISGAMATGSYLFPGVPSNIILLGAEPIVDTATAKITFPAEAWIIAGNVRYVVAAGTIIDYAPVPTSTPVIILFNRETLAFQRVLATNIAQVAYRKSVVIATVGQSSASGGISRVWMPCPFTQNGIATQDRVDDMLRAEIVPRTRQVPALTNGKITRIDHLDTVTLATIRRDTFTFSETQIKEERVHVPTSRKLTYTTTLATLITEES